MRFRFAKICRVLGLSIIAGTLTVSAPVQAAFIVPDSTTAPFQDWTRNDANSLFAGWDKFTSFNGPNAPDIGSFPGAAPNAGTSSLKELTGSAFLTGGGNIYSPEVATSFEVTVPNYGNGAGWNTRFAFQLQTLGSEADLGSVALSYDNGGVINVPLLYKTELDRQPLGGFGGSLVDTLFVFDTTFNPSQFKLTFHAAESSMSLDVVAIDTFTSQSPLAPVPEPATSLLAAIGLGLVGVTRWLRVVRSKRANRG